MNNKPTTLAMSILKLTLVTLSASSSAAPAVTKNLPALRIGVAHGSDSRRCTSRAKNFFAKHNIQQHRFIAQ